MILNQAKYLLNVNRLSECITNPFLPMEYIKKREGRVATYSYVATKLNTIFMQHSSFFTHVMVNNRGTCATPYLICNLY